MKINTQLEPIVAITNYSHDIIDDYELTTNVEWIKDFLSELEEQLDDEDIRPAGLVNLKMQISRKTNTFLGDHLILHGQLVAHFHLPCGRCLFPLAQNLEIPIDAAFLHESKEKFPEYAEATTVFTDNMEMELYFFYKGMADIREAIHEQIFIEVAPFPRCDGECRNPVLF